MSTLLKAASKPIVHAGSRGLSEERHFTDDLRPECMPGTCMVEAENQLP